MVAWSVAVQRTTRPNVPVFRARVVEFAGTWFPGAASPVVVPDHARGLELVRANFAAVPAALLQERLPKLLALGIVVSRDTGWVELHLAGGDRSFTATIND